MALVIRLSLTPVMQTNRVIREIRRLELKLLQLRSSAPSSVQLR